MWKGDDNWSEKEDAKEVSKRYEKEDEKQDMEVVDEKDEKKEMRDWVGRRGGGGDGRG